MNLSFARHTKSDGSPCRATSAPSTTRRIFPKPTFGCSAKNDPRLGTHASSRADLAGRTRGRVRTLDSFPIHHPNIGFGRREHEVKRAVVARDGACADLMRCQRERFAALLVQAVGDEEFALVVEEQAAVVVEPDGFNA